jgi:uridine phosphorylase
MAPRMFNHNRGLWGYSGTATDGEALTIQATGMGGPSAAIVLAELIELGARRAIRVGTCGALVGELTLGDQVIAEQCICADGASRAISGRERVRSDAALTEALKRSAPAARAGAVISVDLFYDHGASREQPVDALAIEMEAATLCAIGEAEQVPVACLLTVTDTFDAEGRRTRIDTSELQGAGERMGAVALAALGG